MKLQKKYLELGGTSTALLATNVYNLETLQGVLRAAAVLNSPVILQFTRSSIEYLSLPVAFHMLTSAIEEYAVKAWIHLDHGDSYELVAECLDEGFDSVMIDASEKPFSENVKITKRIVKLAEKYDACVEAELGYIAKLGQSTQKIGFTDPCGAKMFVEETGVHALAVAIGSDHGFYKEDPKLDLERLSAIDKVTNAALVLHGGSGTPHPVLREAI